MNCFSINSRIKGFKGMVRILFHHNQFLIVLNRIKEEEVKKEEEVSPGKRLQVEEKVAEKRRKLPRWNWNDFYI